MNRYFWFLFIIILLCLTVLGAIPAIGQEPDGGGFLESRPRWFAEIKTSDPPLRGQQSVYHGSGSWLSDEIVLTCWHNIRDNWKKPGHTVCVVDFRGKKYCRVSLVAVDKKADLALLRVPGAKNHGWCVVSSDPESDVEGLGLTCYGLDSDGKRFRYTHGYVIQGRRWSAGRNNRAGLWTNALVVQGMSGGPAVGYDGEIHGVNLGHNNGETQMVSLSYLQAFLDAANVK